MDNRIDLDAAVLEIARRVGSWQGAGMTVDAVTWRNQGEPWPYPFKVNRLEVLDADSIGVAARKGSQEGRVVLFKGGWVDLEYWGGNATDQPVLDVPRWDDWLTVERFGEVLDRFAGFFH